MSASTRPLVLFLAFLVLASPAFADPSAIPPDPAALHAQLGQTGGLAGAIAAAEAATSGKATSARFVPATGNIVISVAKADGMWADVTYSTKDGTIVSTEERGRFPGEPVSGEWTETASGLKYFDIVVGDGESPSGPEARVEVHYSGWLNDGTLFDSSHRRNQTTTFPLNRVIAGWTEGLMSMKVGGKRKLIVPAELGYGAAGTPGGPIPPNATLIFDVELVSLP